MPDSFNPRRPRGRRRDHSSDCDDCAIVSIHAAREGGDAALTALSPVVAVSIHAAREGGDKGVTDCHRKGQVSIHAAREGGDLLARSHVEGLVGFNPRRPRGRRRIGYREWREILGFNPRRPRGRRPLFQSM